ncbi:hypothetical protein SAMN02799630_02246 [Paenibacillus sp. UNCCL117]|uniref:hypothetical protein n=1 Tax=unclassified Paenibacillus TaxID=185978 RepID=UPI000884498C|nr:MULTISPECIES: hypothetical protein [unclassified Paenibacillus]SDD15042.1 hypothetical protein SAMN04488602_106122 [Paenibacillus sp. cl123]SFW34360.1 hypothetical protein SAMN02799630_02246 [Paenibacillus sp. UNCCL117]
MTKIVLTLLVLAAAHFEIWRTLPNRRGKRAAGMLLLFVVLAFPLAYLAYDDYRHNYLDANIGLGIALMFTWAVTLVLAVISVIRRLRRAR